MADVDSDFDTFAVPGQPTIRKISTADIKDALARGWDDFTAMPTFAIFLVVIYPVIGLVLFSLASGHDMLPLVFPLMAGFALIGPLAAVGLYELSRRRELGQETSMSALSFLRTPALGGIIVLGIVLFAIFIAWLIAAQTIYTMIFGTQQPSSLFELIRQVLTTSEGWTLIIVGCGVGFLFALLAFSVSVISFPMVLDRHVGATTAIVTSVQAVLANPLTMAIWGLIVSGSLLIGSLPLLVGLIVVLPVLGHSTWHLYRKTLTF
ncbi:MAG: DUF2189 domain-containing protein [Rhodomicrobiaceae bacterium]